MRYIVYKVEHQGNARWYARPLLQGELAPYPLIYVGPSAKLQACYKAMELNEKAGAPALAA